MTDTLETLREIREINAGFPYTKPIKEWKEQGGKVVGFVCTYMPEEILHAAGLLPIRITGDSRELELSDANALLYTNICSFARACLQLRIQGDYDFLDGLVGGNTCDGIRRMIDVWRVYAPTPFFHLLPVPKKMTTRAREFFEKDLERLKVSVEEFFGARITDQALLESINVHNTMRRLFAQLYELRKRDAPPISGSETLEVVNACYRMPKEQFNEVMGRLVDEASTTDRKITEDCRIMISGSPLSNPDFISGVEELGGLVVVDDLDMGIRYWSDEVETDPAVSPLEAISRRYLIAKFPCARMSPGRARLGRLVGLARDWRVQGVISAIMKHCMPYSWQGPMLEDRLQEVGIPMMELDVEYGMGATGQMRTRVQAFLEILQMEE